ncbi:MAG: nitrogen regulation protein NR(II) [Terriglobales bacterium]
MSRERLASIVESMMEAVITVDRTQRIVLFNKAAETIFRCPREQALGKTLDAFIPGRFRASHRQHIQEFGHTGVTRRSMSSPGVLVGLRADGEEFPMEATISQSGGEGEKFFTVVLRDITERKVAEEKLVVAGRMAATVAHEINGPLEAVATILFLLERAELTDTAREFVRAAQEEVNRISQITKLTLGFHREGEKREAAEVRASELIDGILTLYGHRIESLGVTIVKRYDSTGAVVADAGELRQVLSNLIVNAADVLAEKGDKLHIHVRDSQDWRGAGQKGVRITIADNGSGIPREVRHKLFEPFFTTKGEKGTGLGLWVSRSLVEKQGGRLRVQSIPGIGTTFSIFLPSNAANAKVA